MRLIDQHELQQLYVKAAASDRKRSHLLLHSSHQDKVQRLLIGMVKGSYVEPHYHELEHQWEMFAVLQGIIKVTLFTSNGVALKSYDAGPDEGISIIELAPGDVHSVECLSPTALLLEIKEGPFNPDFAKTFPLK